MQYCKTKHKTKMAIMAIALAAGTQALAADVTITNPSFDLLVGGTTTPVAEDWGTADGGDVAGWTGVLWSGAVYSTDHTVPTDNSIGWINSGGTMEQTLTGELLPYTTYTLELEMIQRLGQFGDPVISDFVLELRDGAGTALPLGILNILDMVDERSLATYTVTTGNVAVGDLQLYIGYTGTGQRNFDNVTLDAISGVNSGDFGIRVNQLTGGVVISNTLGSEIDLDLYEISSDSGSLTPGTLTGIDGGASNDGSGWEVLGSANSVFVSEGYLEGDIAIETDQSIMLGKVFDIAGTEDLVFKYKKPGSDVLYAVSVEYVTPDEGDVNMDGVVDQADLDLVVASFGSDMVNGDANFDGNTDLSDLFSVRNNQTPVVAVAAAVPEPVSIVFLGMGMMSAILRR